VTVFNSLDITGETGAVSLQALPVVPGLPDWLTLVGQGYRFTASEETPRTLAFNYLQREVPDGYEQTLQVYFSGDEGATWERLPRNLNMAENLLTTPANRSGLYVTVATVDIPILMDGWNLFSYPIPESRPVAEALASIDGKYTTVYGYDTQDPENPWKIYSNTAPAWVSDLERLEYGQGYWINTTQPITLELATPGAITETQAARPALPDIGENAAGRRPPPAIYYGKVNPTPGDTPQAETRVTAWIGGRACGEGTTSTDDDGSIRYVIAVHAADASQGLGCGVPGRRVDFKVGDQAMKSDPSPIFWDNRQPNAVNLTPPSPGTLR
jgi:hypothetical protein